jgi:hypothetical protein
MKMPIIDQADMRPTRKVTAMTVAGALLTVGLWVAKDFYAIDVPGEVQGTLHTALAAMVGYFVRDRMNA